jgi:hypothetical protein
MKMQHTYRPGHSGYVSDFTQFMNGYLARRPDIDKDQQRGWYKLWDRRVDLKAQEKEGTDTVPVKSYYYE